MMQCFRSRIGAKAESSREENGTVAVQRSAFAEQLGQPPRQRVVFNGKQAG